MVANHPSLPNLDFGEIDLTPPSLRRQSRPYSKPIGQEFGSIPQLPSSFSDASSLLDSSSHISDVAIKSISSRSQARVHDTRHCLTEYYVDWKWEFFASLIVIACPLIIVSTLYPNAGKPLPEWPFQISINTLLSIYGLVFKTCLTFIVTSCIGQLQWFWFSSRRPLYDVVCYDRATRGPWGSIQLLCSEHIRSPLTVLGAIILIATVAIDPFIQQLVSTYDCSIALLNLNATIPRTNQFNPMSYRNNFGFPVRLAVYTPSDFIAWQCSTGNCTFSQIYGTLAYCSSCEDWSDKLFIETKCYDTETDTNATSATGHCADNLISFETTSLYTGDYPKPEDSLSDFWINVTIASSPGTNIFGILASSVYWANQDRNQFILGDETYILVPKTIDPIKRFDENTGKSWTDCNTTVSLDNWRCQGYGAAVCSLQPCIRTYNATINGIQLDEYMISSSGTSHWGFVSGINNESGTSDDFWIGMIDTHCISEKENETLTKQGYKIDSSSQWLAFNRSIILSQAEDNLVSSLLLHRCLYLMNLFLDGRFPLWNEVLGDNFWGDVENLSSGRGDDGTVSFGELTGPQMMVDLYNDGYIDFKDVQETFSNISDITTAWIRTNDNSTFSDPAIGEVLHYATCLRIQWPWIAFPAALAVLSLVCFVAVVVVMDRQRVPVWKSSPLALIMRGSNREFWCKPTSDAMEKRSKEITVILIKGSDPQIQVVRKDFGLVDIANGGRNNSSQTLNGDVLE